MLNLMKKNILKISASAIILFCLLIVGQTASASEITGDLTTGAAMNGVVIAPPVASPVPGTYTAAQNVTLTAPGSSNIRYTINGATPDCATGTVYSGSIAINSSLVIKALSCYPDNKASSIASFSYTINISSGGGGSNGGGSTGGGGGGGAVITYCANVAYSDWGICVNGIKQRAVSTSTPIGCSLTTAQRLEQSKLCIMPQILGIKAEPTVQPRILPQVLGVKYYANGQLIRGKDKKIYLIQNNKLAVIRTLAQLRKYAGQKIYDVPDPVIRQYMGFLNGQLIRGPIKKIYVITKGKKQPILNLIELSKYRGQKIYDVSDEILGLY